MGREAITILICILASLFSVYREYQRTNKARLAWRIIAVMAAAAALACMALPLTYNTVITEGSQGKILLTNGYNKNSLPKNDSIFTLDKSIHLQYPKAKLLDNVSGLFDGSARIGRVHIYGYGLDESDLKPLAHRSVSYHPSPVPDGFTAISWTQQVKSGRQFSVQGTYKNTSAKAVRLLLKGLNTTMDSVRIPSATQPSFTLTSIPKNSGRAVYNLLVLDGNDTLQNEQLPVIIEPNRSIKFLILSASPDFETKFLKNWLGGNGYGVAARTNITKGKLGQEYINIEQTDLSHITSALLGKFDILVADLSVVKTLSAVENSALESEVAQKGLGLIIRWDSSGKAASWLQRIFPVNHQVGKPSSSSILTIQGAGQTAALIIDPDFIIPQSNTQALVSDQHNQQLASMAINGGGKLIFTTIRNSYSWKLAGNEKDYAALWSLLIDKACRKSPVPEQWSVKSSLPVVGQPVELMAESASPLVNVAIDKTTVYPAQNPAVPFQHTFTYWPSAYGWQSVSTGNKPPFWWYVWDATGWQTLREAKKINLNHQFFKQVAANAITIKQIQQKTKASVPKIYFYILFLMAATFLWAEGKFYN